MTSVADLTVAIATRERPAALLRCLDAILAGSVLPAEVLVVDQSVGNATADAVRHRAASAPVPVRHVRQPAQGLSRSRNAAFREAAHELIAVTDDDCVPDERWVEVLTREPRGEAPADAVTGRVLPLGPEVEGLFAVSSRTSDVRRDYVGPTVPWEVGTGGNFCVRRGWLARVGGYDVRLGAGSPGRAGEDMDVLHRLLDAGARIRYEPEAIVYHERQPAVQRAWSRFGYGHGIGACCGLWLRDRDAFALRVLGRWLVMRVARLTRSARARHGRLASEELDVLRGTFAGLGYGLRVGGSRDGSVARDD